MTLKPHTVFENDGIDCRDIKCCCGNDRCRIGLSFDEDFEKVPREFILRLHDKYGNENAMRLTQETMNQLKKALKFNQL